MQGLKRKLVYVMIYECIAMAMTTVGLMVFSGQSAGQTSVAAIVSSTIALIWNLIYNTLFEIWEIRQAQHGRSLVRRIAHALGFELGLLIFLVPFLAWWLHVSLLEALLMDIGLIVFFLIYTFIFNTVFDKVFGLPASALPSHANNTTRCSPTSTPSI